MSQRAMEAAREPGNSFHSSQILVDVDNESQPLLTTLIENGHELPKSDLVDLSDANHHLNPMTMPPRRKWACACFLGAMTFAATFSSSVFNAAIPSASKDLDVSSNTMALATSLYIFGFATGPILMGPASELKGRKLPFFLGYLGFILSQIPVALGQNVATVLTFRFLGGVASSASPAIVGGYLADFLPPVERGVAVAIFAATTLIGPEIGAIVGALLVESSLGWRWTAWASLILGLFFSIPGYFVLPETYRPVLEQKYAARLRRMTRRSTFHSRLDKRPISIQDFVVRYLTRPFTMLMFEPILLLMTLYISFTFGLVYLLFVAYPISFVSQRGFSIVNASLTLIPICFGIIVGALYVSLYTLTILRQKSFKKGRLDPEDRLPPMIVGAIALAAGLFWFAWTSSPEVIATYQICAGFPIGFGIQVILLQALAYLIDIYTTNANSAVSGTVIVRSLIGGVFPLFAQRFYHKFGVYLASSLLGYCALLLMPIPIIFYHFGAKIRSFGSYGSRPN